MASSGGDDDEDWDSEFELDTVANINLSLQRKLTIGNLSKKKSSASLISNSSSSSSTGILQNRKEESDSEEWDADFGGATGTSGVNSPLPQMKILGIKADPTNKTEWDDDFVFNDSSESENKSLLTPAGNILSRVRSTPAVIVTDAKIATSVTDLLSLMPFGIDIEISEKMLVESRTPPLNGLKMTPSESETKKKLEAMNIQIELASGRDNKLELSKRYFDLGSIYQSSQQTIMAFNQFSMANKILQDHKEDFDTPIDENNDDYEFSLYSQLGLTSKAMANIFNTTEYLKKALDISANSSTPRDKERSAMIQKINVELGMCYMTSETPIYATKFFEAVIRTALFAHCANATHQHTRECLDLARITDWSALASGSLQMAKTLKVLGEGDLSAHYLRRALHCVRRAGDRPLEVEAVALAGELARTSRGPQTEDNATTKDFESESEEEDWDAELGLDVEEDRPVLQLAGQSPSVIPAKDRMPAHYKLIDSIANQTFEIVKYPKPSYLFSLTTPDGHLFLHEEALSNWLASLVVKHLDGEDRALRVLPQKASLEELRNEFAQELQKYKRNTKKWARLNLEFCYTLHIFGHDEQCWDSIVEFFLNLRDSGAASPIRLRPSPSIRPNQSGSRMSVEIDERDATYHIALQMLYLAAKLWRADEDADFKHMFQGLRNISQTNAPHVELLVAETYSHHLHHKSRASLDSDNEGDDSDRSSDSDEEPELRTRPDEFSGNEEEKINPLNVFLRVYHQCRLKLTAQPEPVVPRIPNSNKEHYEVGIRNAMVRALVDVHFHLNGISPLTTKRLGEPYTDVNVNATMTDLLDANIRMRLLTEIYLEIPPTFLKAKAAYALGLHSVDVGDLVLAEKFFFECLYIIDRCRQPVVGLPLVLSELAANASIGYASVLLDNYKYQYAIVSFDNALLNYSIRKKKEYTPLLRRVATLARENDDIAAAIYYYKQILNAYLEGEDPQSKTNEINYICEVLSTLYWEKGAYKQSEEFLKVVFLILHKATSPITDSPVSTSASRASALLADAAAPKFDNPIFFQMHTKLATLYMESYHFEKGLELLITMRKHPLPHGRLNSLLFLLAKAYTKVEWFDEATAALNALETDDVNHSIPSFGRPATQQQRAIKTSYHAGGSGGNSAIERLKYWELNCLNLYHANRLPEALVCVEAAILSCASSSLSTRGQYFYIRGKIFQRLVSCSNATLVSFPTTLRPTTDEWRDLALSFDSPTTYTCTGDFIQEGIASFKRAYHYFKSIGDDVKIQKTVSRIAETYLDRVFGPVALLHYPFDNVARLPHFTPSVFIQRDSEHQQDDRAKRKARRSAAAGLASTAMPPPPVPEQHKEFYISFELIENPATLAIDINVDTCNILQLLKNYMNMAELKFLQGDRDLAISYWSESRNLFYTLFCDGPHLIGRSAPLQFIKKVFASCKRMIRFLFAFDQELINKNLMLVDSYLALELDIQQAKKRVIEVNKPLSYEAGPQISKVYMPYLGKSYTIGRNFKKNRLETTMPISPSKNGSGSTTQSGGISNLTFAEKTRDEEKSAQTGDEVGERIWGSFHAIKNEIRKYSLGKITQEELSTRNKLAIKQITKILNAYKSHSAPGGSISPSLASANSLASLFRSQTKMNLSQIAGDQGRSRTPSNAGTGTGTITGTLKNVAIKYEELSFNAVSSKINASLQKLVYAIQVDNYLIHYVPNTGRKRFNRIGGSEELTPLPPPASLLYLEVFLLSNANERVSFIISPLITLDKILLFLCNRPYWATEDAANKKKGSGLFFGSFSRAMNNSFKSTPKFVDKTANFHTELLSFLASTIGPPGLPTTDDEAGHVPDSPPQERHERAADRPEPAHHPSTPTAHVPHQQHQTGNVHHAHINTHPNLPTINIQSVTPDVHGRSMSVGSGSPRRIYTQAQLSLISMAKRMVKSDDPAYSKAFVSIDQLSYQVCKVFSHREMRECSEANPLQLFLFVNSGEERKSLSSLDSMERTTDQAITFSPEVLSSFAPLLSLSATKDPQDDLDRKKIISELKHTTFASLFEILPTEKPDSSRVNHDLLPHLTVPQPCSQQMASDREFNSLKKYFVEYMDLNPHRNPHNLQVPLGVSDKTITKVLKTNGPIEGMTFNKMVNYFHHLHSSHPTVQKKTSKSTFGFFGGSKAESQLPSLQSNISTTPLIFICSKSLQVFPWELIIPDFLVRYLSLYDVMKTNYIDETDPESEDNRNIPSFISICNSTLDKVNYRDGVKKENALKTILYQLYTTLHLGVKPSVQKKKYKYLDFYDLATAKISGLEAFLESYEEFTRIAAFGAARAFSTGFVSKTATTFANSSKFTKVAAFTAVAGTTMMTVAACADKIPFVGIPGTKNERTFIAVKPDGTQRGLVGEIISRFERKGYKLVAIKMVHPTKEHAEAHYADLNKKPFFPAMVKYFSSGPVVCFVFEGKGVVKGGRTLIGATDPAQSLPGSIRGDLCIDLGRNIIHGSDSTDSARDEITLWFKEGEVTSWNSVQPIYESS
eukprot:gene11962-13942_t